MQQDTSDALNTLDRAFAAAMEHNRALLEQTAGFLRDESFRFMTLRLDRAKDAVSELAECRDLPGLVSVQKDWMGDLVQDCAAQSQRYSEFWRQGAERMRAETERQAQTMRDAAQAAMDQAAGTAEAAAAAAHEAVHGAEVQASRNFDEAREAMTPDTQPTGSYNDQLH